MPTRQWLKKQEWIREQVRQQNAAEQAEYVLGLVKDKEQFRGLPGLREMLVGKAGLEAHLQAMQKQPVVVSVDRVEGKWVYVVRGIRPPISYWGEHEVWFVRGGSSHVWTPTRKLG